ncbi:golgin subfamily A member 3 [Orycteropus afer afer]|uniref:Golgin subfamily A member 3 n=1 Tax=Orycteropus afer afer TaxID=1230840 RepID=A0AC54ZCH1_ORYAF|nr:golgin subfamily A member 3 [Orycteropus afer afer]
MDGTSAMQGGLSESIGGTLPGPRVLLEPPDPLVQPAVWGAAWGASGEAEPIPSEGESLEVPSQGHGCQNGPVPPPPGPVLPLDPTPNPAGADSAPGVAGIHDNIRRSEGTSAEGSVREAALRSLRLSLPMQETRLCSTEASLPLEREEQVRLQARKRLEEQLRQYRAKRQQERSSQPAMKTRLFSTLDPELMLNPENLPRASTVALTKEYSFLRTSVPRGPKVGSLGLLARSKEKKSPTASRIRSLADYRTDDLDAGDSAGGSPAAGPSRGSLKQSRGSVTSVVSEAGLPPEADAHLEDTSLAGDDASEADGSEAGLRLDGNDSDSSSYSSTSPQAALGALAGVAGTRDAAYMVNGQEVATDALGHFPSIKDVLQAAAAEHRGQGPEVSGDVQSRRGSLSSSVSIESSVAEARDEMLQVLKEKMRLEGQLEALSLEASQALKEKAELQAQLAALNARLQAQVEHSHSSQQRQDSLSCEVDTLKQSCWDLERAMTDLQSMLEAKNASLASSNNDLQVAEEQYQRLMAKVEDMQKSMLSKDNTVRDLRRQMSALQSQLQQVRAERTTLTSKLRASQAELSSLQSVRQWYQQQLALAQEARVRLQGEMAHIQVGQMTQAGLLEHLKLENVSLSHQLTETQHRSIKEKERIAVQLQSIEADMLDQEAAFVQIQEAKTMVEEDLQRRLEEFEDEKAQLQKVADSAASLEQKLEQVKLTLHQRDQQLEALQQEHLGLMRQLTATQEALQAREQSLGDLRMHHEELQAQLEELQGEVATKDDAVRFLQHEKIVLEVALQAARSSQEELDRGAKRLGEGTEQTVEVLEQLRQDLAVKSSQVECLQQETATLKRQTQKVKEQFLQQKVMVEAYRRDATSKDQLISELKATKKRLDSELKELRQELIKLQGEKKLVEAEHSQLQREVSQVHRQMADLEGNLQVVQKERDDVEMDLQSLQFDKEQMMVLTKANEMLKKQIEELQEEAKMAITEQKHRMQRLGSDLSSAQKEMKTKHRAYENAVGILSRRLQEALAAQESAEAKLGELRAQGADVGGSSLAFHERIRTLEVELQTVSHGKMLLEKELQEVISMTSQELEEQREKVLELEDELQEARGFQRKIRRLEESNKKLALELEHERGKLTGLGQSSAALREHNSVLETALAKREADLVQLNLQVQAVLQRKEKEDQQMKQLVQALQTALEKEKAKGHSLQEQRKELKGEASSSNPVTPVKIPDCPVPASLLEELLRPPPAVSKEPLKNLNTCLQQLKQEMDSLQRQMEEHTITVHESLSSWTQVEGRFGDSAGPSPAAPGDHTNPSADTEKHNQSSAPTEVLQQ